MTTVGIDDKYMDGNIPSEGFLYAQRMLDAFVDVAYDAAYPNMSIYTTKENEANLVEYKRQVIKLISDNPPLQTVPAYFKDGRENYLWYSDFFDYAGKEVFRSYYVFTPPTDKITPANYAEKLAKINLPYFKELVELVGLLKTIGYIERRLPKPKANVDAGRAQTHAEPEQTPDATDVPVTSEPAQSIEDIKSAEHTSTPATENIQQAELVIAPTPASAAAAIDIQFNKVVQIAPEPVAQQPKELRSYQPKMTSEQYALVVKCINHLEMFRRNIKVATLREMFEGKKSHTFQVINQKRLTYLLDQLRENKLIKWGWITVAIKNQNFVSTSRRDGNAPDKEVHYITQQQFSNCRTANKKEWISCKDEIDDLIESITGKQ